MPWGLSWRRMQVWETSFSVSIGLLGSWFNPFWMKLTSGREMVPEMVPLALMSTRSLPSRVNGSVPKGAGR